MSWDAPSWRRPPSTTGEITPLQGKWSTFAEACALAERQARRNPPKAKAEKTPAQSTIDAFRYLVRQDDQPASKPGSTGTRLMKRNIW
jgi:hypothetical protein